MDRSHQTHRNTHMLTRFATLASAAVMLSLAGSALGQTSATNIGGRLTLTTGSGDQNVKVEMKEAAGVARVFGFPGIADGTAYAGISAVTVITGSGRDRIELDIAAAQSVDIRVHPGSGDLESKLQWKILPSASPISATASYSMPAGGLKLVNVEVDNEAQNARIDIDTGNGTEVSAKVLSDDPSSTLGVAFMSRGAKTSFELTSAASILDAAVRGNHAGASSEVKHVINQIRPGTVRVNKDVSLGTGSDTIESKIAASGSVTTLTGGIRAGSGNDTVLVEAEGASVVNGLALEGGAGDDFLSNQTKGFFQLSQTVGASIFGGAGNDVLILTTDTAIRGTGLPNDVQSIIDGGDGFDLFNAFGLIRNCEGRL